MQMDQIWPQSLHDDEFPFQIIEDLCTREDVEPEKRFYLLDGSMKLLKESIGAGQLNDSWHPDAFSNLCMLLPALVADPLHKTKANRLLAGALPSLWEGETGIQFGNDLLRTLVDLGFERSASFWISYDIKDDATRGTIVFQALQRSDQLTLFAWIAQHESTNLERLKEVLKRLTRPLQRECGKNLEFAKTLRISLKNLQLDRFADNLTQIGIRTVKSSTLLSEVKSSLSQDRRIADIGSSGEGEIVEVIFLRKYDGPVQQFVELMNKMRGEFLNEISDELRRSFIRTAVGLLLYRNEARSTITVLPKPYSSCP
jgi:hypothetical protein